VINPNSGTAGSSAVAQGFGFESLETVKVYWDNPRTLLGEAAANINGTFGGSQGLRFTIPAGARLACTLSAALGRRPRRGAMGYSLSRMPRLDRYLKNAVE